MNRLMVEMEGGGCQKGAQAREKGLPRSCSSAGEEAATTSQNGTGPKQNEEGRPVSRLSHGLTPPVRLQPPSEPRLESGSW